MTRGGEGGGYVVVFMLLSSMLGVLVRSVYHELWCEFAGDLL